MAHIDDLLEGIDIQDDQFTTHIDKSWGQGRTVFGGISAALTLKACDNLIDSDQPLRSFHCNFIAPILVEEPLTGQATLLRHGKNVSQISAQLQQNGQVATMIQVCYGRSRASKLHQPSTSSHNLTLPRRAKFIPQIPKLVPKYLQHFDLAFEKGNVLYQPNSDGELMGWCRFTQAPKQFSDVHLIALLDCWPPTMFQMAKLPPKASSMSWDVEIINPVDPHHGDGWFAYQMTSTHIKDGYCHEEGKLWDKEGRLIALSRQVVAFFV